MIESLGNYSLLASFLLAGGALVAAVAAARYDALPPLRWARWAIGLIAACLTVSVAVLLTALLSGDFRLAYVAGYTLVDGLLLGLILRVLLPESALGWWALLSRLPGEVLLTALAAGPFLILFLRLDVDAEPEGRRAGLGLIGTRL